MYYFYWVGETNSSRKCKCSNSNDSVVEHGQWLTPLLFQNDVALYFEPNWKWENMADTNLRCFIKLND